MYNGFRSLLAATHANLWITANIFERGSEVLDDELSLRACNTLSAGVVT